MTAPPAKPLLFYDCPLKAAFMAKYFGMQYEGNPGFPLQALTGQTFDSENGWSRLYLDAESLLLLVPQAGDITLSANKQHAVLVGGKPFAEQTVEEARANVSEHGFRIIQRDGAAFHWPEQEAL